MQTILDRPMPSHRLGELFRRELAAHDIAAHLLTAAAVNA
jgi:hypothetical protein